VGAAGAFVLGALLLVVVLVSRARTATSPSAAPRVDGTSGLGRTG